MKENSKIFEKTFEKKVQTDFFSISFLNKQKGTAFPMWFLHSWPSTLYSYVISKQKKLRQPAWSHFEDLLKSFKTVMDFAMFFSFDECETLKNILSLFLFCHCYYPMQSVVVYVTGLQWQAVGLRLYWLIGFVFHFSCLLHLCFICVSWSHCRASSCMQLASSDWKWNSFASCWFAGESWTCHPTTRKGEKSPRWSQ